MTVPRVALLHAEYAAYTKTISYLDDWLDAFQHSSLWEAVPLDISSRAARKRLPHILPTADLVVALHSTNADSLRNLRRVTPALQHRVSPLVLLVGNEVDLPEVPLRDKIDVFQELEPELIATQLPLASGSYLWDSVATRAVIELPHALNERIFKFVTPHEARMLDVGVRGIRYGPYLGDSARNDLMDALRGIPDHRGLAIDISEERLSRREWAGYLDRTRTTFSSEAGSPWLSDSSLGLGPASRRQEGVGKTRYVLPPDSVFRQPYLHLPKGLRKVAKQSLNSLGVHTASSAGQLPADFRDEREWANAERGVSGKCVSSRHFDALGAGATQVLLEGDYNGLLAPGEHYIELKADYSNWERVLDAIVDVGLTTRIAVSAREYAMDSHRYLHRMRKLREAVDPLLR